MIKSWISSLDFVQIALMATAITLMAGLALAISVAWANAGSRTLVLATSTLGGAIVSSASIYFWN